MARFHPIILAAVLAQETLTPQGLRASAANFGPTTYP